MRKRILYCLALALCLVACTRAGEGQDVFALLDLDRPGLEQVKGYCNAGQWDKASGALLAYFRAREDVYIPGQESREASETDRLWADDALRHTFHVLEDPVWNYGKDIDWTYWPVKNIEMRVQLHRQGWWTSLAKVYATGGEERYAREYVDEFRDWVKKNPYRPFETDERGTVSSGTIDVDSPNACFAWRPLEIGIRLLRWCRQFALLRDAKSFTPAFLLEFLRAYHEQASVLMQSFSPAGNHLIHQSSGIIRAGICFPEFKEADTWIRAGVENLKREISRQSYPDGCHFELDPGYHIGVVQSYDDAIQVAFENNRRDLLPPECLEQLVRMTNYYLDYCYPDGTHPCFSDARRHDDLASPELLADVAAYSDSPAARQLRWFATGGAEGQAPSYRSAGHPDTGFYTFRDGWLDQAHIIMPIKATERGRWHAQPDFGTFELWAYGKVLMPDAGAYTYSGDEEIERQRAYFKATARHNALTLDDRDYDDPQPKVLAWDPRGCLCVEHQAYEGLTRRRSIRFVEEKYFVIEDEVSGPATGRLTLRCGLGLGTVREIAPGQYAYRDGNAGLRIVMSGPEGAQIRIDQDWFSEAMHEKTERPVIRLDVPRSPGAGTQRFVTILYPFSEEAL